GGAGGAAHGAGTLVIDEPADPAGIRRGNTRKPETDLVVPAITLGPRPQAAATQEEGLDATIVLEDFHRQLDMVADRDGLGAQYTQAILTQIIHPPEKGGLVLVVNGEEL